MVGMIYQDNASWAHINSSAYEVGMAFHVSGGFTVSSLQWFRYQTGSQVAPEIVRLWNADTSTELARLTSIPDDGTVAWQAANLATPVDLVVGTNYIVSAYFPGTAGQPSRSTPGVPTSPVVLATNFRRYLAGTAGLPTSADAGSYIAVDIGGLIVPGPNDPPTQGSIGALGDDWLSSDPTLNTHQDDLPWRTDANVTILRGEAEGASGFAAIKSVVDTIATSVGSGLRTAVTTLSTNLATANAALVHAADTWSDALAAALQAMSDDFASFFATTGGTAGGPTGALSGRSAFPTELWTLVDETDFTFQISWDVPADLYTISLTGIPARINTVDVDGAIWRPRVGWWATRNGDLLGARSFLSWGNEYVEDGGRRMPGIVIRTQPEIAGHVQAWRLT
jgi:hypothetical protein